MFYKIENAFFVSAHDYLLKSFQINIQKNQLIDLTISAPTLFLNLYNVIPKLAVKALLPRNYNGLESPTVVIVDGNIRGKSTHLDFYSFVDYAIQYGMNINSTLERIIVTRSFTAYQLADTIICNLSKMIQKYKSNIIIITDLFATDEQLHLSERKRLLQHMVKSINSISESIIAAIFSPVMIDGFQKIVGNNMRNQK
jgi:Rad51